MLEMPYFCSACARRKPKFFIPAVFNGISTQIRGQKEKPKTVLAKGVRFRFGLVGNTGFEPVTSTMSR